MISRVPHRGDIFHLICQKTDWPPRRHAAKGAQVQVIGPAEKIEQMMRLDGKKVNLLRCVQVLQSAEITVRKHRCKAVRRIEHFPSWQNTYPSFCFFHASNAKYRSH